MRFIASSYCASDSNRSGEKILSATGRVKLSVPRRSVRYTTP